MSERGNIPGPLRIWFLTAALAAAAVSIVSCGKGPAPTQTGPRKRTVTVKVYLESGTLYVNPATVVLSKSGKELIEWDCTGAPDCAMDFDPDPSKRPFTLSHFQGQGAQSDLPVVDYDPANPCKKYKYKVTAGGQALDPDVIVER